MAIIRTAPTPNIRYTPFTGLTELERARSGIARAEVVYSINDGVWPAAGAGDSRLLDVLMTLNKDYGYVLTDCTANFEDSTYLDLESVAEVEIQTTPGHPDNEIYYYAMVSQPSRQDSSGTTGIGSIQARAYNTLYPRSAAASRAASMSFQMLDKPKFLIYPFTDPKYPPSVSVRFSEEKLAGGALEYKFTCRFLQYDISQGYNYVVQTPQLTR